MAAIHKPLGVLILGAALLGNACAVSSERTAAGRYGVAFQATLIPADATARVTMTISQKKPLVHQLDFRIDPAVHTDFQADGDWQMVDGGRLRWTIPEQGGAISYLVSIPHQRGPGRYDAWIDERWAMFRGDDLFPPARTRMTAGAQAQSTLTISAPAGWSVVTPFGSGMGVALAVENPRRRFDRPTGWMVAGELGVRVDQVGNTQAVVAGPTAQGIRRQDMLALLNWTLPTLNELFGPLPERLLIVSAGDPMWRGGLSGPRSLFIHADRPLISENGTSSLVHELVHVVLGASAAADDDWLVEGVAEYYALEVLRRSGTISQRRFDLAHAELARWGKDVKRIDGDYSRGEVTARAVTLLLTLHRELASRESSLDAVIASMLDSGAPFSRYTLSRAVESAANGSLPRFSRELQALLSGP